MAQKPLTIQQTVKAVRSLRQEVVPPVDFNLRVMASIKAGTMAAPQGPSLWARAAEWFSLKPALVLGGVSGLALALLLLLNGSSPVGIAKSSPAPVAQASQAPAQQAALVKAPKAVQAHQMASSQLPERAAVATAPSQALPQADLTRKPSSQVALQAPLAAPAAEAPKPHFLNTDMHGIAYSQAGAAPLAAARQASVAGLNASISEPTPIPNATSTPVAIASRGVFPNVIHCSRNESAKFSFVRGAKVSIYDRRGRQVAVLADGNGSADSVPAWRGTDESGRSLASGIYLVRIQGQGYDERYKVVLVR